MSFFTDRFVQRPVLSTVISLIIVLLGLKAYFALPVRQYPALEDAKISIDTNYSGADAELMQGFITTPIQQAIASAQGIDYITSTSSQSSSSVSVRLKLGYNANNALTEIMSKVEQISGTLPVGSDKPVISKRSGSDTDLMYLSFHSDILNDAQIADYLSRVVQPKLATLSGVAAADIFGASTFAMRIWLDPIKMSALGVTATAVSNALQANNFQSAPGEIKGEWVVTSIKANTDLHTAQEFRDLIVRSQGDQVVRIGDIAKVELGSENYDTVVMLNGKPAVYVGLSSTPDANPLTVIDAINKALPSIAEGLPKSISMQTVYDATQFIRSSIHEVVRTLIEASLIVIIIMFLFLGNVRSVIVPLITIPLSLIGIAFFMLLMGYSINLLTLLAMVLAIGLVVDDAIVVVENIQRHIEEGMTPFNAALQGAREVATAVIAMTITLAAVYAPIGFLGGLTGTLFKEFAFTLAGSVIVSGIIALTLSPMMSSKLLTDASPDRFTLWINKHFDRLKNGYANKLTRSLNCRSVTLVFLIAIFISLPFLYLSTYKELAPTEDQGVIFISGTAPEYANLNYLRKYTQEFPDIFKQFPEYDNAFEIDTTGTFVGMILKPWDQRKRSQREIQVELQKKLSAVTGLEIFSFSPPSLPGSGKGTALQFVLKTTDNYPALYQMAERIVDSAQKSGLFTMVNSELQYDRPQIQLDVDRGKAGLLGISMLDIGQALSGMLSEGYVSRFSLQGRSYKVIPQVPNTYRSTAALLKRYTVTSQNGDPIPLVNIIHISTHVQPSSLTQFQQQNSTVIQAINRPGVSMEQAIDFFETATQRLAPKSFSYDFKGGSRQYVQQGSSLVYVFGFSFILIFLVLSAQFESFRDALIILISVPMSICGALMPLTLGLASVNIYTQIGLVTLIGLIAKHGILIVEFANQLQIKQHLSRHAAVIASAKQRLRPILMTTATVIVGVIPLLFASGAGALSRFDIGLVISAGMFVGTLFTLFVVPMLYTFLGRDHTKDVQPMPEKPNKLLQEDEG